MKYKKTPPPKVLLIWDEDVLTITPAWQALADKALTFYEKKLEPNSERPWIREVVRQRQLIYTYHESQGVDFIKTWQGMWWRVISFLKENNVPCEFSDTRLPFPLPQLDKMFGFRCLQKEHLTEGLIKNCSGLFRAPTRYGKSTEIKNTLRAYPDQTTVVLIPGADLMEQTVQDLKKSLPNREILQIGGLKSRNKFTSRDITVCSMDSMHRLENAAAKLVIIDEPHEIVTNSRLDPFKQLSHARKLGFGATTTGRFDGRDILVEALIGPVLSEKTFTEAVAEGAICQIVVLMVEIAYQPFHTNNRDNAYKRGLYFNERILKAVEWLSNYAIPAHWQTLIFVDDNQKQAEALLPYVNGAHIAIAQMLTKDERENLKQRMQSNEIKRCIASSIYAQGVTFSDLRSMINVGGGGASLYSVQKAGRLAETRPGKKAGLLVDFYFTPTYMDEGPHMCLYRDSEARKKVYTERGYSVRMCHDRGDVLREIESIV